MEKFSVSEVIEQAVQTEKLGADYYTAMANKFKKNEELSKLFETLSKKEIQHEKTFARLKNLIKDEATEGWDEVSKYLRAVVESAFFLGNEKSMTSLGQIRSMSAAVDHALGFEKETLAYYYGIRDGMKDKEVIDRIINEEKKHIMQLNEIRSRLKK